MFDKGILMFLIVTIRCISPAPQHQISNKFNHHSQLENHNFIRETPTKETEYESEMSSGEGDNVAEKEDEDENIFENDGQVQITMKSFANDTDGEQSETYVLRSGQTKKRDYPKLCTELSEFTPNLCDDELAQKRCEVYCGSDCSRILPPLACGKKLPPEPAGNPIQSDSKAESTRRSGESTGTKRVLGSQPAEEGEWPWTVRLLHSRSPDLYCGGAILNKRFILTNARCFVTPCDVSKGRENCENYLEDRSKWTVIAGDYSRSKKDRGETKHKIKQIFKSPDYTSDESKSKSWISPEYIQSDIAVVQLEDEIKFTDKDKSNICLPDSAHTVGPTQNCYINGWGFTDAAGKKRPDVLQSSMLKLISPATCNLKEAYNGHIRKGELCAANVRDTSISCNKDKGGDEGSSVVCRTNDMWYAVGIAIDNSWACRLGQIYGVYTDTAFHKPWIIKTVLDDSL